LEHNEKRIKTTLRQVVIPELTDTDQSAHYLRELKERYPCVDKIELLPFRKLCTVKYQALGIDFPFANLAEPDAERVRMLQNICES
jgi:pyruvate formate lyase activating enzyme